MYVQVHGDPRRYSAFLRFQLVDVGGGRVLSESTRLLCEPKHASGLADPGLRVAEVKRVADDRFEVHLSTDRVALFVYLVR